MQKINYNKTLTILSIIVSLSSIGVFGFFKDSINKVSNVLESVERIEQLEKELTKDKEYYNSIITNYKKIHYKDSIRLDGTLTNIKKLDKRIKEDSIYIYWSYDWIVYLKKQHNL